MTLLEGTMLVLKRPPGLMDEKIREAWVGIVLPFLTLGEVREKWAGTKWENPGPKLSSPEYVFVEMSVAIAALRAAGKEEAADKWQSINQADGAPYRPFSRAGCVCFDKAIEVVRP